MYQQVTITGKLAYDPRSKENRCQLVVPVTRKWTNADGTKGEKTTWFYVTVWGRTAEACTQYLSKGSLVQIVGEMEEPYIYEKEGQPTARLTMRASNVVFLQTSKAPAPTSNPEF